MIARNCRFGLGLLAAATLAVAPLGTALAEDALKVGAVIPLTGTYGSYGKGLAAGMKIALDEINAAGGVLGQPVELLTEDDQTDATAGLNAAKKLIDVNKVDAIIGTFASSVTMPILSYSTQAKIPVFTVAGAPDVTRIGKETGLVYRFVSTEGNFGQAYALYARQAGLTKAYALTGNNAAHLASAEAFGTRFAAEGGTFLGTTVFEPNQSSYRSEVTKALDAKPDVIVIGAYTNDAIVLAKTILQLEPDVKLVGPLYALNDEFTAAIGGAADGVMAADAMSAEDSPAYQRFEPLYKAATGDTPTGNPYAVMDYDELITLALAAQAAKSTDPAVFLPFVKQVANAPGVKVTSYAEGLAALAEGKDIEYSGASSTVDFDDNGDLKSMFFRTFLIEGGKAVPKGTVSP